MTEIFQQEDFFIGCGLDCVWSSKTCVSGRCENQRGSSSQPGSASPGWKTNKTKIIAGRVTKNKGGKFGRG